MKQRGILGVICVCLVGCSVGPKYKPPEISLSDQWTLLDIEKSDFCRVEASTSWWEVFKEELLTKYIEKAAVCNHSVLIAEANIKQARALKKVTASQLFPQLLLDFDGSKTYFSKNGPVLAGPSLVQGVSAITGLPFQLQFPQMQSLYNVLVDVGWEIDLFGKVRKEIEIKEALIGSSEDERNKVLISVFAEIAINYMELRSAQQMGKLLEHTIRLFEEHLIIEEKRRSSGFSKALDLISVESDLAVARSELPLSYAKIYQSIYAISILIGELPEHLLSDLLPIQPMPNIPDQIAVGMRSDLIRRRPDIGKAERLLSAATSNVGVAIAAFFPVFTLSGDLGFQSLKLVNLFTGMSKTWSIGGDVNMPLFQGGRLIGNLRVSEAQAVAAAQHYQQIVLDALEETEGALSKYQGDLNSYKELNIATQKDTEACDITTQQYIQGYINGVDRIQSEKKLNNTLELELEVKRDVLIDLIVLYKALGGGFQPFQERN